MKFKNMPLIVMLVAGLVTSIMTVIKNYDTTVALTTLFIVLLSFYVLGIIGRCIINRVCFPKIEEEENKEDKEENNEESEGSEEEGQETPQEESSNEENRGKY